LKKIGLFLMATIILTGMALAAFDKKVVYPGKTYGDVTFDHAKHLGQKGVTCKVCHPAIIAKMKAGVNKITMADINKGKFCGVCHAEKKRAFAIANNCAKCHIKPKA